jgi:hypothetical protein
VLQTDGTGNLSWAAQTGGGGSGSPGGSNTQVQFNDEGEFGGASTFTYNKNTNILSVGNITVTANGSMDYLTLTHDANANVVYANYLYGDGSNITNLPVGNISTINLDGNSANLLYGNGVFAGVTNPFDQDLNTTDNVQFANITSTDALRFKNGINTVGALGYAPTFIGIEGYGSNSVNIITNDLNTWSFNSDGVLSKSDANGLVLAANYSAQIVTDYGDNNRTWTFDGTSGELVLPGDIKSSANIGIYNIASTAIGDQEGGSVGGPGAQTFTAQEAYFPTIVNIQVGWTVTGNNLTGTTTVTVVDEYSPGFFEITTDTGVTNAFWYGDTYTFTGPSSGLGYIFDTDGNLTLPSNTFSINYANGTQVSLGGVAEASFSIQNSNFNATVGSRYGVDTSGGAVTATLPASPATGAAIFFADAGGAYSSNNLTIARNGQTIMGASSDLIVSTNNQSVGLFFNGTTWRTYNAG